MSSTLPSNSARLVDVPSIRFTGISASSCAMSPPFAPDTSSPTSAPGKRHAAGAACAMTPLDLTQRPPRSCRAELDGIQLPRAIDKARAELPGRNRRTSASDPGIVTMSGVFSPVHGHHARRVCGGGARCGDGRRRRSAAAPAKSTPRSWRSGSARAREIRGCDVPSPAKEIILDNHPVAKGMPDTNYSVRVCSMPTTRRCSRRADREEAGLRCFRPTSGGRARCRAVRSRCSTMMSGRRHGGCAAHRGQRDRRVARSTRRIITSIASPIS